VTSLFVISGIFCEAFFLLLPPLREVGHDEERNEMRFRKIVVAAMADCSILVAQFSKYYGWIENEWRVIAIILCPTLYSR
jgi:hypothetical protein